MEGLYSFRIFDLDAFIRDKDLTVVNVAVWKEFGGDAVLGTDIVCRVTRDDTPYPAYSSGEVPSNLGQRLSIKIAKTGVTVPLGSKVVPVDATATVWGAKGDRLTIKAAGVKVVTAN